MRLRHAFLALAVAFAALPAFAATMDVAIDTQEGQRHYKLEVASTPEAREVGLMNRDRIGRADGMIFLFPAASDYNFWMKHTRIPLDMLFVDAAHTVTHIETAQPQTLNLHHSGHAVVAVIELDGGRAAREGIAVGDRVRYAAPQGLHID